jgi:hypothetical protein
MFDFSTFAGQEVPGGCARCDAYQTVREEQPGLWVLTVHHDEGCRFYRERAGKTRTLHSGEKHVARGGRW